MLSESQCSLRDDRLNLLSQRSYVLIFLSVPERFERNNVIETLGRLWNRCLDPEGRWSLVEGFDLFQDQQVICISDLAVGRRACRDIRCVSLCYRIEAFTQKQLSSKIEEKG